MAKTIELSIEGMTCDHCVRSVTNTIQDTEGVESAKVDLENKSAVVEGDSLDLSKIIAAIKEEGYEASVR